MEILKFNVSGSTITRTDTAIVVSKSKRYIQAQFTFNDEWTGLTILALFENDEGESFRVKLKPANNYTIHVPYEVLDSTLFKVSCYSSDDTRITTNEITIPLEDAGYTDYSCGTNDPYNDVFDQIFAELALRFDDVYYDDCTKDFIFKSEGVVLKRVHFEGGSVGTETDPVFTAHVAHSITQADIDRWNSGTGTESDPVFTASPAHNITADDVTALKTGYEARIASLETQLSALQTTVTRLDTTLSTSIQNEG